MDSESISAQKKHFHELCFANEVKGFKRQSKILPPHSIIRQIYHLFLDAYFADMLIIKQSEGVTVLSNMAQIDEKQPHPYFSNLHQESVMSGNLCEQKHAIFSLDVDVKLGFPVGRLCLRL